MMIDKLRATYTNMNKDEDEDEDEDKEEKASSEGNESAGGMKRRWMREGEMTIDKLRAMHANMDKDEQEDNENDNDDNEGASSEGDEFLEKNEDALNVAAVALLDEDNHEKMDKVHL